METFIVIFVVYTIGLVVGRYIPAKGRMHSATAAAIKAEQRKARYHDFTAGWDAGVQYEADRIEVMKIRAENPGI